MYDIVFRARFERTFKKFDIKIQRFLLKEIEKLATDPFSHPNIRKISGVKQSAYRLRIGRWRVLYFIITTDMVIEVIDVFLKKSSSDYNRFL